LQDGPFSKLRAVNLDRLEVAARTAATMNEYLTSTPDAGEAKIQRLQIFCLYIAELLDDACGALRFMELEETIHE
jgi:hypothetical protein